jgi:hypothetical protein
MMNREEEGTRFEWKELEEERLDHDGGKRQPETQRSKHELRRHKHRHEDNIEAPFESKYQNGRM